MTLARAVGLVIAGLMVVFGALFTFQGLGYVEGSSMTGVRAWTIIGPVLAGFGVALAITVIGSARRR